MVTMFQKMLQQNEKTVNRESVYDMVPRDPCIYSVFIQLPYVTQTGSDLSHISWLFQGEKPTASLVRVYSDTHTHSYVYTRLCAPLDKQSNHSRWQAVQWKEWCDQGLAD